MLGALSFALYAMSVTTAISSSSSLRISVLDQAPVSEGMCSAQALRNSLDLAVLADRLGYHR